MPVWQMRLISLCLTAMGFGASLTVPDTLRFLFVVGLIVGAVYGGALALSSFPPEQSEIIKPLPHEKLRAQ